jgi:CheY-like chemotaxis protein
VLVSDLRMPGQDGYALIRHVRALGGGADLPAVAITGVVQPEERRRALTAGFQSFVPKPFQEHALVDAVRRVSRRR